jgi:hypothetical protein
MKMYKGVEVQFYTFLTLALDWSGKIHTPAALPPEKELQYPLDRRLGGPQRYSECSCVEQNIPSLPLPGFEPWSSACSLVTILNELLWISMKDLNCCTMYDII